MQTSYAPHQQRVVDEAKELSDKISKLAFFLASDKAAAISPTERTLMGAQLKAMQEYSVCLQARIRLWSA